MSEMAPEALQLPEPVYGDTPASLMLAARMIAGFQSGRSIPLQRQLAPAPDFSAAYYGPDADGNISPLEEQS